MTQPRKFSIELIISDEAHVQNVTDKLILKAKECGVTVHMVNVKEER